MHRSAASKSRLSFAEAAFASGPGSSNPGLTSEFQAHAQLPVPVVSEFDTVGWLATIVCCLSCARFFQGSTADPDSVNTGVTRVTGEVKLDTNDLGNSVFDLSIYPADEQWGHALSPEATLPAG
jgi:hypothetical protein